MDDFKILVNFSYRTQVEAKPVTVTAERWEDFGENEILDAMSEQGMTFSTEEEARVDDWTEAWAKEPDRTDRTAWRVTAADLDEMAGRELTDEELTRIVSGILNSTASEAIEAAVDQVVPPEVEEDYQ